MTLNLVLVLVCSLVLTFAPGNVSATPATWIYPAPGSTGVYNSIDTINASWASNYQQPNLRLWCKAIDRDVFIRRFTSAVPSTGSHEVLLNFGTAGTCHFTLANTLNGNLTDSAGFDVQLLPAGNGPAHTYGADAPTSAPTTSIDPKSTAAPTTSISVSPAASTAAGTRGGDNSKGLSTGAGIGIGVAAVVGAIVLVALAIIIFLRMRRRRKIREQEAATNRAILERKPEFGVFSYAVGGARDDDVPPPATVELHSPGVSEREDMNDLPAVELDSRPV